MRHLIQRGTLDVDGVRHSAKVAWRALALLQRELDAEKIQGAVKPPADPLAQRPDENAKQHRDRVNSPWDPLDPTKPGEFVPWPPAGSLREGYRPGRHAR